MAKKEKVPDLKFEDLVVGKVYRAKKPKLIGIFDPLVDDRQILHISSYKQVLGHIDHGYNPEYLEWCKKTGNSSCSIFDSTMSKYEKETEKSAKNIETIWDHTVQYESPSVKIGQKRPSIPASKFIKWAAKNIQLPEGEWGREL